LLGETYAGYFPAGDDERLAALMRRFGAEPEFRAALHRQCEVLRDRFTPEREAQALRAMAAGLLRT
jgi:hypothetical protein